MLYDQHPGDLAQHGARFLQDHLHGARILVDHRGNLQRPRRRHHIGQPPIAVLRLGDHFLSDHQDVSATQLDVGLTQPDEDQSRQIVAGAHPGNAGQGDQLHSRCGSLQSRGQGHTWGTPVMRKPAPGIL